MAPLVEFKDVHKNYMTRGGVTTKALRGVSFSIAHGEYVALIGPSGSGKSSLMHILGLLDLDFTGTFLLDGNDVRKLSATQAAHQRSKNIGFVFQQFNLLKRTTALQNVLLPTMYNPRPDDEVRAVRLLESVGLADFTHKRGNELSGGQIQRVAIARALIMKPQLLLADEPTGNLDSHTSSKILKTFKEINAQGTTVVLITHSQDVAKQADRILHIRDGVLKELNT